MFDKSTAIPVVTISPDVCINETEDETILINNATQKVMILNKSASMILDLLVKNPYKRDYTNIEELSELIKEKYNLDKNHNINEEVLDIVNMFFEEHIIC